MHNLIQISDCHVFADPNKVGYGNIHPIRNLRVILREISAKNPDTLIATGDISGDGSALSYQHFLQLIREAKLEKKLLVIPGNHDSQTEMEKLFAGEQLWTNHPYINLGNHWQIHLLDTQDERTIGNLAESSLDTLALHLDRYSQLNHLIATHHHPIACGGWMDKHEWINRHQFRALVKQNPAVKAVIYGHIHMDIQQILQQCLYLACPSTCWQFEDQANFGISDAKPGYRVIKLSENGQIDTSIYRLEKAF